MRSRLVALVAAVALALAIVAPAGAITNGVADAGRHPSVGLVGFYSGAPSASTWLWRCSASLIAPSLLLTAAHCTAPDAATGDTPVRAQVWFDENIVPNPPTGYNVAGGYLGTPHFYPSYNDIVKRGNGLPSFSFGDVGVVVLDGDGVPTSVVPADKYTQLPDAGLVDTLASGTRLDQVGYGVSKQVMAYPGENPYNRWTGPRDRMFAPSQLVSGKEIVGTDQLKHSSNQGGGKGGTCFGDSGGPILLGGTNIVLAVNSYVTNSNCAGVAYATRVDLTARLNWIESFLD